MNIITTVLPTYDSAVKLMTTDTDSLLYHVHRDDIYEDMAKNSHHFDFSNYDKDHPLYDATNARKPGIFKDETAGIPMQQFVGIRSKMYSTLTRNAEHKRAKGFLKSVIRNELKHQQYFEVRNIIST